MAAPPAKRARHDDEAFAPVPMLQMNNGAGHPQLGYGTYKVGGFIPASSSSSSSSSAPSAAGAEGAGATARTAAACVADALKLGYRCFDCAEFYGNEADVGAALAASA